MEFCDIHDIPDVPRDGIEILDGEGYSMNERTKERKKEIPLLHTAVKSDPTPQGLEASNQYSRGNPASYQYGVKRCPTLANNISKHKHKLTPQEKRYPIRNRLSRLSIQRALLYSSLDSVHAERRVQRTGVFFIFVFARRRPITTYLGRVSYSTLLYSTYTRVTYLG